MKILITGGCGFVGSNLAAEVLKRKEDLIILDSLYRYGSSENLQWLKSRGGFRFIHADIRNTNDIEKAVKETKPDVIFHVAGQVAMTDSINNPRMDFEVNALGTLNVLEAVRAHAPETIVIYSSTNKVYGDLEQFHYQESATRYNCVEYPQGYDETVPLDFHSPYGCSKGTADMYVLDYARIFDLKSVVFRHSSIYGGRQFATYDQGWIGWFSQKAIETKQGVLKKAFKISGNGKQVRDILHVSDAVSLYFKAIENIEQAKGQAFNVGGGIENSLSLLELFNMLEEELNIKMSYVNLPWRKSDQKVFVADTRKASRLLEWTQHIGPSEGVRSTLKWLLESD